MARRRTRMPRRLLFGGSRAIMPAESRPTSGGSQRRQFDDVEDVLDDEAGRCCCRGCIASWSRRAACSSLRVAPSARTSFVLSFPLPPPARRLSPWTLSASTRPRVSRRRERAWFYVRETRERVRTPRGSINTAATPREEFQTTAPHKTPWVEELGLSEGATLASPDDDDRASSAREPRSNHSTPSSASTVSSVPGWNHRSEDRVCY